MTPTAIRRTSDKTCTHPTCTQPGGWVYKRPAKGAAKAWRAADPTDKGRRCWFHGPGSERSDPGKQSGELMAGYQWDDVATLDRIDKRLTKAARILPDVRAHLDEAISEAMVGTGGRGSGVNDPTGGAAMRIGTAASRHRELSAALAGLECAVETLSVVAERCLTRIGRDDEPDEHTKVKPDTCPVMVLRVTGPHPERGRQLVRCGANTAHKVDEAGNPVGWDEDGYCLAHRAEAEAVQAEAINEAHMNLVRKAFA